MKILYHSRTFGEGGGGVHIQEIVKELRKLGHKVILSTPTSEGKKSKKSILQALRHGLPGIVEEIAEIAFNKVTYKKLKRIVEKERPNFIYARYALFDYAPIKISKEYKIPIILEVNGPLTYERKKNDNLKLYKLAERYELNILKEADAVIAVSNEIKKYYVRKGINEEKINVLRNGVEEKILKIKGKDKSLIKKLGLTGKTVIGYVGFLQKWHKVDMLVRSFKQVLGKNKDCVLLVVGDGEERKEIERYAKEKNISDKIIITGVVKHDDIHKYISLMDIAVLPDCVEYCSPMKLIEYMAMKKACIVPDRNSVKELVKHNKEVYIIKSNEKELTKAMLNLIRNKNLRTRLGTNAQQRIKQEKMLWKENAKRTVQIYKKIKKS